MLDADISPKDVPPRLVLELDRPDRVVERAWGPQGGYTNGIDVHTGKRWVIRRSTFQRIGTNLNSNYSHAVAAILFWNGGDGTLVEDVAFLDCESGVVLGLTRATGPDGWNHANGTVRRAWFYRSNDVRGDRAFGFEASRQARIEDVKVVLNGTYPNAVEYRFPQTTGFVAAGVRSDAEGVVARADPGEADISDVAAVDSPDAVKRVVLDALNGAWPATDGQAGGERR
jgi:hypothetical protein